jgi:CheY-like chemotaxis protein
MTILAPGVIAMTSRERAPRVLVVDEQQPIREFIDQLLTAEGYEVELAPSLEGARERLAGGRPDLVICDARVPGAPVFPILDVLDADERTRRIPVLLCTGVIADVEASPERLIRPGTELLLKPFDIDDLLGAAERLAR